MNDFTQLRAWATNWRENHIHIEELHKQVVALLKEYDWLEDEYGDICANLQEAAVELGVKGEPGGFIDNSIIDALKKAMAQPNNSAEVVRDEP